MQTQRFYPTFAPPPGAGASGRYSPSQYSRAADPMRRTAPNLFGPIEDGLFHARAEAALVASMDLKGAAGAGMFRPGDVIAGYPPHPQAPRMSEMSDFFGPMATGQPPGSFAGHIGMDPHQHSLASHAQFAQYPAYSLSGMAPHPFSQHVAGTVARHAALPGPSSSNPADPDSDPRELEHFAEHFKQRRIKLGVTQADVGKALANLKLPGVGSLSQSTICRFESLTLSHNNMVALKPILDAWLTEAEALAKMKRKEEQEGMMSGLEKKRKRTSIAAPEKRQLEMYFRVQPRPSGEKIAMFAEQLDLKKNVVRVWFCNQRQKQKRLKFAATGDCLPGGSHSS